MKPSEILLAVYNDYVAIPVHVRNCQKRVITDAERQQCSTLPVVYKPSKNYVCSLDARLTRHFDFHRFPHHNLEAKCYQYLWASIGAWTRAQKPPQRSVYSGTPSRRSVISVFNDTAPSLYDIEEVLLGAYLLALSEDDPSTEFTTLDQVKWANEYVASMPPDAEELLSVSPKTVQRWLNVLNVIDYFDEGHIRDYPNKVEFESVIDGMKALLLPKPPNF